jgi:hypothetical protein
MDDGALLLITFDDLHPGEYRANRWILLALVSLKELK